MFDKKDKEVKDVKPDLNSPDPDKQTQPQDPTTLNDAANLDLNKTPETSPRTGVNPAVTSAQDQATDVKKEQNPKELTGYMRPGDETVYVEDGEGSTEVKAVPLDQIPHSIKELDSDEFAKKFTIVGKK